MGEQWLAILPETHECHHEIKADTQTVHHHGATGCAASATGQNEVVCSSHSCGSAEVILAQLHAKFTVEVEEVDLGLQAVLPPNAFAPLPPLPTVAKTQPRHGPAPPPLPAGRQLLVAYQTFLI